MIFAELGLDKSLAIRCESLGFTEPTPIQKQAIPVILSGSDLIGCAATGTGKTAAFLLPMLQMLATPPVAGAKPGSSIRALVLTPTRELASQIAMHLQSLAPGKKPRSVTIVGGASSIRQRQELRAGVPVVIATPGRLIDHLENGVIDLSKIEMLVLDEADRMLDMGFRPAIRRILSVVPTKRQTLLFSATMSSAIEEIARQHMHQPKVVEVNQRGKAAVLVRQMAYPVSLESKTNLLLHLLEREGHERVLIFTRTRRGAERLSRLLASRDLQVNRIHADRTQPQREAALRGFKEGHYRVLVATDIAARGIDVEQISHVINFDVPDAPEDYIHRIGRTGRAGKDGCALSLVTPVDELSIRAIERMTGQRVERVVVPGFGGLESTMKTPASLNTRSTSGVRSFSSRRGR